LKRFLLSLFDSKASGSHLDLGHLRLIKSKITNVDFGSVGNNRNLADIVFDEAEIYDTNFANSNLEFSQFRSAYLERANFSNANLYRAAFDSARLCHIVFTGADLYLATFWNSSFDLGTEHGLRNAAWWLGVGWTAKQTQALLQQQNPRDTSNWISANSNAFKTMRDSINARIKNASTNEERAQILNQLAWTLAIYGVDLGQPGSPTTEKDGDGPQAKTPRFAKDAAEEALRLINSEIANNEDNPEIQNKRNSLVYDIEDTLGYVLLQLGEPAEATSHLRNALGGQHWETLFRLAVAENAIAEETKKTDEARAKTFAATAITDMTVSVRKGYVPWHERALLAKSLEFNGFRDELDRELKALRPWRDQEGLYPSLGNVAPCDISQSYKQL